MVTAFHIISIVMAYAIWGTGAWTDDSPRTQDLLAMLLLGLIIIVLALTFSPYTHLSMFNYDPYLARYT